MNLLGSLSFAPSGRQSTGGRAKNIELAEFALCLSYKVVSVNKKQYPLGGSIVEQTIACETSKVGLATAGS